MQARPDPCSPDSHPRSPAPRSPFATDPTPDKGEGNQDDDGSKREIANMNHHHHQTQQQQQKAGEQQLSEPEDMEMEG